MSYQEMMGLIWIYHMSGDITNTRPVTVYYIGGEKEQYYYVPVTKRVSNNEQKITLLPL